MQGSFWKLAALTGVAALGVAIVVQVQRNISRQVADQGGEQRSAAVTSSDSLNSSLGDPGELPDQSDAPPPEVVEGQTEPLPDTMPGTETSSTAAEQTDVDVAWDRQPSVGTNALTTGGHSTSSREAVRSSTTTDPYGPPPLTPLLEELAPSAASGASGRHIQAEASFLPSEQTLTAAASSLTTADRSDETQTSGDFSDTQPFRRKIASGSRGGSGWPSTANDQSTATHRAEPFRRPPAGSATEVASSGDYSGLKDGSALHSDTPAKLPATTDPFATDQVESEKSSAQPESTATANLEPWSTQANAGTLEKPGRTAENGPPLLPAGLSAATANPFAHAGPTAHEAGLPAEDGQQERQSRTASPFQPLAEKQADASKSLPAEQFEADRAETSSDQALASASHATPQPTPAPPPVIVADDPFSPTSSNSDRTAMPSEQTKDGDKRFGNQLAAPPSTVGTAKPERAATDGVQLAAAAQSASSKGEGLGRPGDKPLGSSDAAVQQPEGIQAKHSAKAAQAADDLRESEVSLTLASKPQLGDDPFDSSTPLVRPAGGTAQGGTPSNASSGSPQSRANGTAGEAAAGPGPFEAAGSPEGNQPGGLHRTKPLPLLPTPQSQGGASQAIEQAPAVDPGSPTSLPEKSSAGSSNHTGPTVSTVEASQRPHLTIQKIAPPNAVLGKPMVYTILIKNQGNSFAKQVLVEDEVPKQVELVGTIPQAVLDGNRLIWRLGDLKPGEERKILVKIIPKAEGEIGSVATVSFVAEVAAETRVTQPRLQLEVSGPSRVKPGAKVTLRFFVRNDGTADATGVVLRNISPEQLQHPAGNDLEYDVGTLPAGESRTIDLVLTAKRAGKGIDRAILTADGGIEISKELPIEVMGNVLKLTYAGPPRVFVGQATTLTFVVENTLDEPLSGVSLRCQVPPGAKVVEASDEGELDATAGEVRWTLSLPAAGRKSVSVKVVPQTEGTVQLQARVVHAPTQSKAETVATALAASISALSVELEGLETPVVVGQSVKMTVRVRNRGPSPARNVRLRVTPANQLAATAAKAPVAFKQQNGTIEFSPLAALPAGSVAEFALSMRGQQEGTAVVRVEVESDDLPRPLVREEAVAVLGR